MSQNSKQTTEPEIIRKWVEAREGKPARVRSTATDDRQHAGILRVDLPGGAGEDALEPISWDLFFETFREQGLTFLYEDKTAEGKRSNFCKFVRQSSKKA